MITIEAGKLAALLAPHLAGALEAFEDRLSDGMGPLERHFSRHLIRNAEANAKPILENLIRRALTPEQIQAAAAQIKVV